MSNTSKQPNLLFIFPDQLGACYMGCYGHPQVRTPNLDRLAGESVQFSNAYTACPLCTPFRGTLFTGRYPSQTGIFRNEQRIPEGETTLADLFNRAGYSTCYVGKWHLCDTPRGIWVEPHLRGGFSDFVGWDCGHVFHTNQKYFDGDSPELLTMQGHETDGLTDIACSRLQQFAEGETPFCMFLAYQAPHPICQPPQAYHDIYRDRPIQYRFTVDGDARFKGYGKSNGGIQDIPLKEWTERYFGEITHLDAAIGRLLSRVEELGLLENTIIVFTSDHGEMGGCRGRFEKSVPYEEATHIPLIVRLPGQKQARRTDALFSSVDFMPTLLALCDLPAAETAEGVDYSGLIKGLPDSPTREDLIIQFCNWACIRRDDVKLTLSLDGKDAKELYRLDSDPFEQENLIGREQEGSTIETLRTAYVKHFGNLERRR
jgi:arylsulfatase A-like enzyme